MESKIGRWGNSLGLRIPKAFAEEIGIAADSEVDLSVQGGELVVRPKRTHLYRLDDLLAGITPENVHREVDTGGAVGEEIW